MSAGPVIVLVIVLLVVLAVIVFAVRAVAAQETAEHLRSRVRPGGRGHRQPRRRRKELREREKRHAELELKPLSPESTAKYSAAWEEVQIQFVDNPGEAVATADELTTELITERGYPTGDADDQLASLSVEMHARWATTAMCTVSRRRKDGEASTEDLRQALVHYRALFADLLGENLVQSSGATTATHGTATEHRVPAVRRAGPDRRETRQRRRRHRHPSRRHPALRSPDHAFLLQRQGRPRRPAGRRRAGRARTDDDQAQDDLLQLVQSDLVAVPEQRSGSPWSSTPAWRRLRSAGRLGAA